MSDPERLLDGPLPADIARLLKSAASDVPPAADEQQKKIYAAIAGSAALPRSSKPPPAPTSALRNVAWTGLAVAVLIVGALGVDAMTSGSTATTSAPRSGASVAPAAAAPVPSSLADAPALPAPSAEEPSVVPSVRVDDLKSAAPVAGSARPASAVHGAQREAPNVENELEAIDAARAALASGRSAEALSHVQRYRATFLAPHFVEEADALEVQALAAMGRLDEAKAKADGFVAAHAGSPYTQRVRSAAGQRDHADAP